MQRQTEAPLQGEFIRGVCEIVGVLSHEARIRIVEHLAIGEATVSELTEVCGMSQPMTSQHLRIMKDKGILAVRREGNRNFYSIDDLLTLKILDCMRATQQEIMEGGVQ